MKIKSSSTCELRRGVFLTSKVSSRPFQLMAICLLLAVVFGGSIGSYRVDGQAAAHSSNSRQEIIKLSSSLLGKTYCSPSNLRLTTRLTITNISSNSLIVDKDYFAIIHTTIKRDLGAGKPGRVELESDKHVLMQFIRIDVSHPASELFVILKPTESYVTTLNDYISVYDGSRFHADDLKPGQYVHESVVLTWGGSNRLGEDLRTKWREYGVLLLDPLTTEPVPFSVETAPKVGDCGKELN